MKIYSQKELKRINNNVVRQYREDDFNESLAGSLIAGVLAVFAFILIISLAVMLLPENKLSSAFSLTAQGQNND